MEIKGRILVLETGIVFEFEEENHVKYEELCLAMLKCDVYYQAFEFKDKGVPQNVVFPYVRK